MRVKLEPSRRLSKIIGFPYYIERSFTVDELLEKGIIDQADITRMQAGEEIEKQIPVSTEEKQLACCETNPRRRNGLTLKKG